jgi:class 3 adenylate cyclase/predicted ATPase
MFCDLVGNTELSTRVDPERLREVVRAYQEAAAEAIGRFEGHVAQYLGDGLLVYFGYPRAHEDDPQRAVRAGLAIVEAMQALGLRHEREWGYWPAVRLGIHTGLTVVGEVGGGARHEQLALGETPNLAARLQTLAEPGTLLISAATQRLLRGLFPCEDRGTQTLKGVARPVQVYRVSGESPEQAGVEVEPKRPLVGREQELALLVSRWELARDRGQVVLLSGEPGIGKSRLVQALREHATRGAHARWECRCSPYHQQSALRPWIEMAERALGFVRAEDPAERLHKIEAGLAAYGLADPETVDLWALLLSVPSAADHPPLAISPQRRRQKTFDAIVRLLLATAAQSPVLLVVEDLHWADPSTLELLSILTDQVATAQVLILLTARPEFRPAWGPRSHTTLATLGRLARAHTTEMIERVSGGGSLPPQVLDQLVARSDGIPLFAEELAKSVLESGELEGDEHAGVGSASFAVPATLQDSLMARLDRLGSAKGVAQLAATLGRQFSYELLCAVSPLDEETLERDLGRLVEAELLYQRGLPPKASYVFKHALIQEAAYESLLRSTRSEVHKRIAAVLAERFHETIETQPELLAQHYGAAGLAAEAVEYWRRAGQKAIQRSANLEAMHHLERALEAAGKMAESPERDQLEIGLLITLGPVLIGTRGWAAPEVGRSYERARDLCRRAGDAPQLFTALWGLWFYYTQGGRLRTGLELAEQLMGLAERQPDPGLLMQAHHMLGPTRMSLGPLTSARSHFEAAIALYDPERHRSHASLYGGHDPCVCCSGNGSIVHWMLGSPDLALRRCREAIELARRLGQPTSLGHALIASTMLHQLRREPEAAREVADACLTIAAEHDLVSYQSFSRFMRGWAVASTGLRGEGLAEMRQVRTAKQAAGQKIWGPHFAGMIADVCSEAGQLADGLTAVSEGLTQVDETGDRYYEAELYRLRGELLLLQHGASAFAEADACFQRALELARKQEARSWELRAAMSLVRLWQGREGHADARRMLADVYAGFSEGFDTEDLKDARRLLEPP